MRWHACSEALRSKGFAFIEMEDDAAAAKAIAELNGAEDVYKRQANYREQVGIHTGI